LLLPQMANNGKVKNRVCLVVIHGWGISAESKGEPRAFSDSRILPPSACMMTTRVRKFIPRFMLGRRIKTTAVGWGSIILCFQSMFAMLRRCRNRILLGFVSVMN
uniref:Abhydrolase_2 domain-containing protein n=1 Tax=Gongylonema pulchrum TaxID=637853 RepID=A0A183DI48_9BILA